jgi:hypothetical protein
LHTWRVGAEVPLTHHFSFWSHWDGPFPGSCMLSPRIRELKVCCLKKWGQDDNNVYKVWQIINRWDLLQATKSEHEREDYYTAWENHRNQYITCDLCGGWDGSPFGVGGWGRLPRECPGTFYNPGPLEDMSGSGPYCGCLQRWGKPSDPIIITKAQPPPSCYKRLDSRSAHGFDSCYLDDGHPQCSSQTREARQLLPKTDPRYLNAQFRVDWIVQNHHPPAVKLLINNGNSTSKHYQPGSYHTCILYRGPR